MTNKIQLKLFIWIVKYRCNASSTCSKIKLVYSMAHIAEIRRLSSEFACQDPPQLPKVLDAGTFCYHHLGPELWIENL